MEKKNVSLAILQGEEGKKFVSKGNEDCGQSFEKTRRKLLKICEEERDPIKKWNKSRKLLLEDLDSQIPKEAGFVEYFIQPISMNTGTEIDNIVFEPWKRLFHILTNHTFIQECINTVAIYNAYEYPDSYIPSGIKVFKYQEPFPESYYLGQDETLIRVFLKTGDFKDYFLQGEEIDKFYAFLYHLVSFIKGDNSNIKSGRRVEFFNAFKRAFPEIIRSHKFDESNKPEELISQLKPEIASVFIKSFSGLSKDIDDFGFFEFSQEEELDHHLFQEVKLAPDGINDEDIYFILQNPYPKWQPDNNYLNSTHMSYELAEEYIQTLSMPHKIKCLLYSSRYIGYKIFNLPSFRTILDTWGTNLRMSELRIVSNNLYSLYVGNNAFENTEKKYWTIYLEVEKMVKAGFTKNKSFELLSKKYEMKKSSISTRYKEKASEARKHNLSKWDIVHNLYMGYVPENI